MEKFLYKYNKSKIILNTVILYPNTYPIGMSSLAFQSLYHLLQLYPFIHCERAFCGDTGSFPINSFESGKSIGEFDAVFVTISYEPDLLNLIDAFERSGIGISPKGRKNPLIIAGGIASSFLFYYLKGIADVTVCAPAGYAIPVIAEELAAFKNKEDFLSNLEKHEGFYAQGTESGDNVPYYQCGDKLSHSVIISDRAEFSRMGLIEISRGCLYNCRFCLVSKIYGEYYPYPEKDIFEAAEKYYGLTGKIGLIAATLTNHPGFKHIIKELNRMKFRLSFSAFRIEGLDDELMELILTNENKTLTIAPEAASPGMKNAIGKLIPNDLIEKKAGLAFSMGLKRLKLYFMVGLPGETPQDINDIIELVKILRLKSYSYSKLHNYNPEFIITINPLVPKPFTQFEGYPMEEIRSLKKKILFLKNGLRDLGRTYVYGESPKTALLQYRLSHHLIDPEEIIKVKGKLSASQL